MWVHADCDGVTNEQYNAIETLSTIANSVYYCSVNSCLARFRNLTNDWVQHQAYGLSKPDQSTSTLKDLEQLSSAHNTLEKAVLDLTSRINNLQVQESQLVDQIKTTSDALGRHPTQQAPDRRSNVVLYGIGESPTKTPKHERVQKDIKAVLEILNGINVQINPDHIIDCFRLGKFKVNQPRPRPVLIKLKRVMDVSAILANKRSLSSPLVIKPDISPDERKIESALLKERWSLIQSDLDRKHIKLINNCILVNGQLHGEIVNSVFKRSLTSHVSVQPMDQQPSHAQSRHQEQSS